MKFGPLELSAEGLKQNFLPLGIMVIIMLSAAGIILARLTELTVFRGEGLRRRADENRIMIRVIRAPRGIIFDRNGKALTRNVPDGRAYPFDRNFSHLTGYVGEASEEEIKSDPSLKLGDILGKTGLEKQYDRVLRGVNGAELIEVDANGNLLGILEEQPPQSGEDIHTYLDADLQKSMTESLAGKKGAAVAIDPVDGSILGLVSSPAYDPNLFIQTNQKVSENSENSEDQKIRKSENQRVGTSDIPIVRPSGSSVRDISPNGTLRPSIPSVQDLLNDTVNMPLFNRAISGEYPPGSIFKLVTATAGLAENKINRQTLVADTGEIRIGAFRFGNWYFDQYGKTEGEIGVVRALTRSNDIFFYKAGEWLGPDLLAAWAEKMGLGQKTGVDLPGEAAGLVPDPKWKEKNTGERWFLGNTYHMAIGQGDVQLTPLQAAEMASAAITGKRCAPRIKQSAISCEEVGLSDENRGLILEGMVGSCSPGGVAFPFFPWNQSIEGLTFNEAIHQSNGISGYPAVACKTGTAQHGGKTTLPHAWIAVAAPIVSGPPDVPSRHSERSEESRLDLDSPRRIILVVLIEESGEGSYVAAPAAKQILERWFGENNLNQE